METKELKMPSVAEVLAMCENRRTDVMKELDDSRPGWEFEYAGDNRLREFAAFAQTTHGSDVRERLRKEVLSDMVRTFYTLSQAAYCLQNLRA